MRSHIGDFHTMGKYRKFIGPFSLHPVSFSFYYPIKLAKTAFSRGFLKILKIISERSHDGLDGMNG